MKIATETNEYNAASIIGNLTEQAGFLHQAGLTDRLFKAFASDPRDFRDSSKSIAKTPVKFIAAPIATDTANPEEIYAESEMSGFIAIECKENPAIFHIYPMPARRVFRAEIDGHKGAALLAFGRATFKGHQIS